MKRTRERKSIARERKMIKGRKYKQRGGESKGKQ